MNRQKAKQWLFIFHFGVETNEIRVNGTAPTPDLDHTFQVFDNRTIVVNE
jgi:hypothetical protein